MPLPTTLTPADPNAYLRPQEWHEAINPFAAAYRGVTPIASGTSAAMRPEDYDFAAAMREAQAQQNAARSGQLSNADAILARAMGQGGPSLAEIQLRDATDRLLKQQAGAIGSIRGQNPALARRQMMDQGAASQQQMAGQAALLRAQEQQQAQALAAQAFGAIRGQDQGMFGAGAQGRQGQNALNVQADLEAQQQNLNRDLANQQAVQRNQAMQFGSDQAAAQRNTNVASGLGQAAMGIATGGGSLVGDGIGEAMASAFNSTDGYYKYAGGGMVPGVPSVGGDSPMNDKVPAMLSPGEVVVPVSAAGSPEDAADFVRSIQSQSSANDRMDRIFELEQRLNMLKQGMYAGGKVAGKQGC